MQKNFKEDQLGFNDQERLCIILALFKLDGVPFPPLPMNLPLGEFQEVFRPHPEPPLCIVANSQ